MDLIPYRVRPGFVFTDTAAKPPRRCGPGDTLELDAAVGDAAHQLERFDPAAARAAAEAEAEAAEAAAKAAEAEQAARDAEAAAAEEAAKAADAEAAAKAAEAASNKNA